MEGLVDLQTSAITSGKSEAYPEQRALAKILISIIGKENLLKVATGHSTVDSLNISFNLLNSIRAKSVIAQSIIHNPLSFITYIVP